MIMLVHLSRAASASHTDIFQSAAEACGLMALKMGQRDKDVRVHHGPPYVRFRTVLAAGNRNQHIVRPPEAVRDDHVAAGGQLVKTIFLSAA